MMSKPRSSNCALIEASRNASTDWRWIFATTSDGVAAGAIRPNQGVTLNPLTPNSSTVGTSGATAARLIELMAMARMLPARTCCSEVTVLAKPMSIRPAIRSLM